MDPLARSDKRTQMGERTIELIALWLELCKETPVCCAIGTRAEQNVPLKVPYLETPRCDRGYEQVSKDAEKEQWEHMGSCPRIWI